METKETEVQTASSLKLDKEGNVNLAVLKPEDEKKYKEIGKALEPSDVNS
ncbi:MAG: toxic anion resistance protein, partial [Pedobacter sp.]